MESIILDRTMASLGECPTVDAPQRCTDLDRVYPSRAPHTHRQTPRVSRHTGFGVEVGEPDSIGDDGQAESFNIRVVCQRCGATGPWVVVGRDYGKHWTEACPVGWVRIMNADRPAKTRGITNPLVCPDCERKERAPKGAGRLAAVLLAQSGDNRATVRSLLIGAWNRATSPTALRTDQGHHRCRQLARAIDHRLAKYRMDWTETECGFRL